MTAVPVPALETERLILRAPRMVDFDGFAEILGDARSRFIGGPYSRADAWLEFAADAGGWLLKGFGYWSLEERATGRYLGAVGFSQPEWFPERELGWMLLGAHEGRGFATEAGRAALDCAFRRFGWRTLVSYIDPPNARSIRLAERLGARRDDRAERPTPSDLVYRHSPPETAP